MALWADAFYELVGPYVCVFVCVFRRLYNKDQKVIQQQSGGYTTMTRRLYKKDQDVIFSEAIIEPLQKTFAYKGCKITRAKKILQILPY